MCISLLIALYHSYHNYVWIMGLIKYAGLGLFFGWLILTLKRGTRSLMNVTKVAFAHTVVSASHMLAYVLIYTIDTES